MIRFSVHLLLLVVGLSLFSSCEKDVFGCTDPESENFDPEANTDDGTCLYLDDIVTDTWDVDAWFYNGNDLMALGLIAESDFRFLPDYEFQYSALLGNGNLAVGRGSWEFDDDFLEVEFNFGTTICNEPSHRFTFDFDDDNQKLTIEDVCDDNDLVRVVLFRR